MIEYGILFNSPRSQLEIPVIVASVPPLIVKWNDNTRKLLDLTIQSQSMAIKHHSFSLCTF